MASINQKHRLIHITTTLGKDELIATRLVGDESISKLFRYEVDLLSANHEITQKDLVGKPVTITINRDGKEELRHVHGYINQLSMFDVNAEGLRAYRAVIVPGLWFAQLSSNNRVFHRKTAKAIIEEVLGEYSKVVKLSLKLNASYKTREYCVQFEETDLAFASRLMAEEGIAYYFVHGDNKLELILTDDAQGFFDCRSEAIEYDGGGSHPTKSTIHAWARSFCFHTGGVEHKDYSEFSPDKDHKQVVKTKNSLNDVSAYKINDFGKYILEPDKDQTHKVTDGSNKDIATHMMESIESGFDIAEASSDCASLTAGGRFQLDHTLSTEKGKYLVMRVQMSAADGNAKDSHFVNQLTAVPASIIPRTDPNAFARKISHSLLAKVLEVKATTADGSDDIYTQVKVKFPWNTAQNSCWVRVQQVFAGKNWGANFVPRVGQEVVVSYINGDPDRPIVTGAVYNGQNVGPNYTATQSGWKTEFEGSKFNEFRFDDKKGSEEIYLEAGKDHNFLIHNDETGKIENNQTLEVVKDRTIQVSEGDETKTIGKGNQSITVKSGNQTVKVSKGSQTVDVQGAIKITSKTSIELKVGGSSIKMTPAGITIKGTTLSCKGDATAEVKAGASLTLKGGITLIN